MNDKAYVPSLQLYLSILVVVTGISGITTWQRHSHPYFFPCPFLQHLTPVHVAADTPSPNATPTVHVFAAHSAADTPAPPNATTARPTIADHSRRDR